MAIFLLLFHHAGDDTGAYTLQNRVAFVSVFFAAWKCFISCSWVFQAIHEMESLKSVCKVLSKWKLILVYYSLQILGAFTLDRCLKNNKTHKIWLKMQFYKMPLNFIYISVRKIRCACFKSLSFLIFALERFGFPIWLAI